MKKHKEIGYELGNIEWSNLEGFEKLWSRADYDTKEKIVNSLGLKAIKLVSEKVVDKFPYERIKEESMIMGVDNNEKKEGFVQGVNYILDELKKNVQGVESIVRNDENIDSHIKDEVIQIVNKKTE